MVNHKEKPNYLVMASPEPYELGGNLKTLPHHLTLMPWFTTRDPQSVVIPEIRYAIARSRELEIVGQDEAWFGRNNDILVRRVGRSATILDAHNRLLDALSIIGGEPVDNYVGENYNPHMTHKPTRQLAEGETLTLDTAQLVIRDTDGSKKIISDMRFGQSGR